MERESIVSRQTKAIAARLAGIEKQCGPLPEKDFARIIADLETLRLQLWRDQVLKEAEGQKKAK